MSILTRRGCCSLTHEGHKEVVEEGVNREREREFTLHVVRKSLSVWQQKKEAARTENDSLNSVNSPCGVTRFY